MITDNLLPTDEPTVSPLKSSMVQREVAADVHSHVSLSVCLSVYFFYRMINVPCCSFNNPSSVDCLFCETIYQQYVITGVTALA